MKSIKNEIENIIQFAVLLLQIVGGFVIKPHIFDLYDHNNSFKAGNIGLYILVVISICFILLSIMFKKKTNAKFWTVGFIVSAILFIVILFNYNTDLNHKTFLVSSKSSSDSINETRVIKGNNYRKDIADCPVFKQAVVKEMDVIQGCEEINDWSDIDKIWPKDEIIKNTNTLLLDYYLSIAFAGISLLSGIQAIKCARKKI